jgi:hypothetical protein
MYGVWPRKLDDVSPDALPPQGRQRPQMQQQQPQPKKEED